MSPVAKCSCQTKAKMAMVKVEKAITEEVGKAKKFTKLAVVTKLGFV
jgi:hypothetical protein